MSATPPVIAWNSYFLPVEASATELDDELTLYQIEINELRARVLHAFELCRKSRIDRSVGPALIDSAWRAVSTKATACEALAHRVGKAMRKLAHFSNYYCGDLRMQIAAVHAHRGEQTP